MSIERWGTLSVKDHLDAEALVTDLLLYDRLVFPVFSGDGARLEWRRKNWNPDLQEQVIEELGTDIVIQVRWDRDRENLFHELRRKAKQISLEANPGFQMTRMVLAGGPLALPKGVTEVRAVAAYHDEEEAASELKITHGQPDEDALGKLGFVISQRLLVPLIAPGKRRDAIARAADLSRDDKYRKQRREFYAWQESAVDSIVRGRLSVDSALKQIEGYMEDLDRRAMRKLKKVGLKTAFTVVSAALPFALGLEKLALLTAIVPAFDLVKFVAVDLDEPKEAGKCEAAAMFVAARKRIS